MASTLITQAARTAEGHAAAAEQVSALTCAPGSERGVNLVPATAPASGGGKRAVVLLSGGLDSTTVLALATRGGWSVHALTIRYGQRHSSEVTQASAVAAGYGVAQHVVLDIDLAAFGGSALTSREIAVPKDRAPSAMADGVPVTYVPARNTVFLSLGLAWAESLGAHDLFIGVNALDYSGYPDCRPEFIEAFETLANRATRAGIEDGARFTVHTPLMLLRKSEIIALGTSLAVDYAQTTSCYDPDASGAACARCDACQLRRTGFVEAGVADPTRYAPTAPLSASAPAL